MKLRKLLSLEYVRNKDRMAVEPIVRITRPDVLHVLEEVKLVVHKIVPEKYRFWKSNLAGVCPRPIAVCPGPQGSLMILDYDFDSCISKLLTVRLHQPADVSITKDNLKDARDLCYVNGVVFIAERGAPAISFVDLTGKRLREYLDVISNNIEDAENVQVHPSLAKPCALCVVSEDLLLCTDDAQSVMHQLSLEFDGVTIRGNSVSVISFPDGIPNIESIYFLDKYAYIAASSCHGGLYICQLSTNVVEKVHSNSAEGARSATEVNRICSFKGNVVFTDSKAGRVKQYNPVDGSVSILLGSGLDRSQDGTDKTCSFAQVKGICTLENTLFVTDVSAGAIKLVTGLAGTITFLKMLGCLYESFGIHSKVSKGMSVGTQVRLRMRKRM
ncbi:Hypothetical predicted protein [Paramuricea clavata]|uniref:Uncharacterized protein n=1 Tax=Paramuricea clavata TaxID=317549 RepID=A0A7D9KG40_PARCT|nr:Hypothetical predicted protein [Paramuricea clavata]